ncbi:MAG: hypothetical protein A2Y65_03595 [Deltaproteobacteria bacterium RBG_13_52_11]|nr:MAG: hypothetical protein A2Y65_03595 [Deltaproteobacteria bacterium RBG_13_52_11]
MNIKPLCFFLLVTGLSLASSVFAQETDVSLLKERIINLQSMNPLGIRTLVACSKVTDYGSYEPLPDNKVKSGDVIFFYFEPQNPSTQKAEGKYEIWLTQDMVVLTQAQQEVFKKEDALEIHYLTSSPRLDIYGVYQLTLADISPGKYLFKVILHDKIKGEKASATWACEVVK